MTSSCSDNDVLASGGSFGLQTAKREEVPGVADWMPHFRAPHAELEMTSPNGMPLLKHWLASVCGAKHSSWLPNGGVTHVKQTQHLLFLFVMCRSEAKL